ncbi:hypothetical protein I6H91_07715 [Micrococcus luteus]|uniref:hypothetical protein n=1 Tax=Micrococcus luteus TaxID=1270 RepID=UPI00191091FC|nr:hypothetical protein [Micrococcus luteus]QQE48060.1 hypothetical protein I6H91_07715 [Micrococcus luteus]UTX35575.1 hypothetical protein NNL26_04940 [Micrococcus luteus]
MRSDLATMNALLRGLAETNGAANTTPSVRSASLFASVGHETSNQDMPPLRRVDIGRILGSRKSSFDFANSGVSAANVTAMVQDALLTDSQLWNLNHTAGVLEAFVFAFKSDDWPTGIYRVTSATVSCVGNLSAVGPLENLGVQREFVSGAGIVTLYAPLDQADHWAGAHGYRISALRASMALYDFHLQTLEAGWTGSVFGGFIPSVVRHILKSDGVTRHPLLAAAYGLPASDPA